MGGGETAAKRRTSGSGEPRTSYCSLFYLTPFFATVACGDGHGHDLTPSQILVPHSLRLTQMNSRILPSSTRSRWDILSDEALTSLTTYAHAINIEITTSFCVLCACIHWPLSHLTPIRSDSC